MTVEESNQLRERRGEPSRQAAGHEEQLVPQRLDLRDPKGQNMRAAVDESG